MLFPVSEKEVRGVSVREISKGEEWRGAGVVLLVDDEQPVIDVAGRMLEMLGFSVVAAKDGIEALEVFRRKSSEIDYILLDLTMPRRNGEETFRDIRRIDPVVPIVLSSGYSELEVASRFSGENVAGFIQKPYRFEELRDLMRKISESAVQVSH